MRWCYCVSFGQRKSIVWHCKRQAGPSSSSSKGEPPKSKAVMGEQSPFAMYEDACDVVMASLPSLRPFSDQRGVMVV